MVIKKSKTQDDKVSQQQIETTKNAPPPVAANLRQSPTSLPPKTSAAPDKEPARPAGEPSCEPEAYQVEVEGQNAVLRQAHAMLEESRDHYADLYDLSPVGYLTLTRDALIAEANLTAATLLGVERDKLFNVRFAHFVAPEDNHRWQLYFLLVMEHGEQQACELMLQRGDGMFFNAHLDGLPVVSGSTASTLRISLTNNSERKRLDRLLQNKIAELDIARLAAEKANLAKSTFLSNMSHELRTPLNAILGFVQLMESSSQPQTDAHRARLQKIADAGWYLLDLINEILELAKIEAGKVSLVREPVSLAELMRACQSMIEPQAQTRGIRVKFPVLDGSWYVQADRIRLKQVVINLLSNALKYNREQGAIAVECTCSAERVRISVKDNGAGLSAEKLAQLFQPFNRLGQEAGAEEGTGIGLVVAKRLVELMMGTIGVESTVGVGSDFWIELTRSVVPKPAAEDAMTADLAPRNFGNTALRTLLCVEDDPDSLMLMEQIIERFPQLRMLSAEAGHPGIELARTRLPDVILMDINLPDISGIEALKILRNDPVTMHIPVIAISANAAFSDLAMGLDAGFFEYLTKPIKLSELTSVLDDVLIFSEMKLANMNETVASG